MLSTHLAELYEVEPRALVQAVKRNIERFPPAFMFQLSKVEFENLKSQIVTSNWGGLRRAAPYAFTEQGVAMLSSVLNSRRAVQGARHQAKLVGLPRSILKRRMAMRAAEKKLVERNLDLIFEFEKYVLEHPEITEKIPRDAVVFMKVAGDRKFNLWSERQAKRQAKKGMPLISVTVKKLGPVHSRIEGLALERAA